MRLETKIGVLGIAGDVLDHLIAFVAAIAMAQGLEATKAETLIIYGIVLIALRVWNR